MCVCFCICSLVELSLSLSLSVTYRGACLKLPQQFPQNEDTRGRAFNAFRYFVCVDNTKDSAKKDYQFIYYLKYVSAYILKCRVLIKFAACEMCRNNMRKSLAFKFFSSCWWLNVFLFIFEKNRKLGIIHCVENIERRRMVHATQNL